MEEFNWVWFEYDDDLMGYIQYSITMLFCSTWSNKVELFYHELKAINFAY